MYDVQQFKEQTAGLMLAHDIQSRIISLSKDRRKKYGKECEIRMMDTRIGHCLRPEIHIRIWLNSRTGGFASMTRNAAERRADEKSNDLARKFVMAILAEFKVKAARDKESPETLRIKLDRDDADITVELYGFPTSVRYSCEKSCVAELPNGKKIPLNELELQ